MRTGHALLLGLTVLVAACASGTTSPSAATTTAAPRASAAPPSVAASMASPSGPIIGAADLPTECVDAIKAYLVAVEPIVKDVQWRTMIETPPEIEDQLAEVATAVDAEVCPDLSAAEAHDAWIAIASDVAPGTLDYIDFVYRP
jgi:hypothetical protein